MLETVAKRYAAAVFAIALDQELVEVYDGQAETLEHLFDDKVIKNFFTSPRIPATAKKQVVDKLLGPDFDRSLVNLFKLLIDKRRVSYLPLIMRYFDKLTDEYRGVEVATIVSAVPLTDEQTQEIVTQLGKFSDYDQLQVSSEVDTGVLGGIKVRLGDHLVLDGTLSSRLSAMRERMYRYRHRGTGAG